MSLPYSGPYERSAVVGLYHPRDLASEKTLDKGRTRAVQCEEKRGPPEGGVPIGNASD